MFLTRAIAPWFSTSGSSNGLSHVHYLNSSLQQASEIGEVIAFLRIKKSKHQNTDQSSLGTWVFWVQIWFFPLAPLYAVTCSIGSDIGHKRRQWLSLVCGLMAGFLLINHHVWGFFGGFFLPSRNERWWILAIPIRVEWSMFHYFTIWARLANFC